MANGRRDAKHQQNLHEMGRIVESVAALVAEVRKQGEVILGIDRLMRGNVEEGTIGLIARMEAQSVRIQHLERDMQKIPDQEMQLMRIANLERESEGSKQRRWSIQLQLIGAMIVAIVAAGFAAMGIKR